MANFSRETFNKLKHYVGVRFQQGVPVFDADLNEMDDIRKYELRTFLKWFVGDGVPKGDDGFRIHSPVGRALDPGSSPTQGRARVQGLPSVSGPQGPSGLEPGPGLPDVEPGPGLPDVEPGPGLPDFEPGPGLPDIEPVLLNNFEIKAGRCLVEGWEVINEESLWYQEQFLYDKPKTAQEWGVPPLTPLDPPADGTTRTDLVYLDVWEREVDSTEDYEHLVHPDINIETCVRLKREWVVRVDEDIADDVADDVDRWAPPDDIVRPGHVYYPLALLSRKGGQKVIRKEDITDLRLTGLSVMSHYDVQQIVTDAYGSTYTLDHDGQPNLKVSLREAINALLRGNMPGTPNQPLTTDAEEESRPVALEDSRGVIWAFWHWSAGIGSQIWYKCYSHASGSWGADTRLTTNAIVFRGIPPFVMEDSQGDIWVFCESWLHGKPGTFCTRYNCADDLWVEYERLNEGVDSCGHSAVEDDQGDIWMFWLEGVGLGSNIRYHHYSRNSDRWTENIQVPSDDPSSKSDLSAIKDTHGNICLFWGSGQNGNGDIWHKRYIRSSSTWLPDSLVTEDARPGENPFALRDSQGNIWVFWISEYNAEYKYIWCRRFMAESDCWGPETRVTTGAAVRALDYYGQSRLFAVEDTQGEIWVFWESSQSGNHDIWYKRYIKATDSWSRDTRLTTDPRSDFAQVAVGDSRGDIWVFWTREQARVGTWHDWDIWFTKIIPTI